MSKLTKAQRDALPASSFADSARRLFPLVDCSDVSDAASLIGKAKNPDAVKKRIMAFAEKKNCPIPAAWKEPAKLSVTFALEDSNRRVDGEWAIYPNATLFVAGDYESHGFSMSPEEMWLACEQFDTPVGGNIEHSDFLKGRACEVRSIRLDDNDSFTLRGEVAVPLWLDEQLGDHERKLSCEWDRETKTLSGIGLVVHPRVPEAALMSAYAEFAEKHSTPQGQQTLQRIHQVAAEGGAVCKASNVAMASSHEASTIQKIHDMATEHGAACSSTKSGGSGFPAMYSASPATSTATTSPKEGRKMSWKDRLLAAISGMPDDEAGDPVPPPPPPPPPAPAPVKLSAATPELDAARSRADAATQRADALEAENRRLQQERIMERAVAFADRMLAESRALPAEREFIIADFAQRATDDSLYGVVNFGEGKSGTRVSLLEAQFAARAPHKLTAAEITPALFSILQGHRETPAQDAGDRKATDEELRKLIGMTATGQTHLNTANRTAPSAGKA